MNKIINLSVNLNCSPDQAFKMFTDNAKLTRWLTIQADVEPFEGGKYELFWNPDDPQNDSTIGCKVTAIENDRFLSFEWKGPKQFKHFMNTANPLTHVIAFFIPDNTKMQVVTQVRLIHTGWRDSSEWDEARSWTEKAWIIAFQELEKTINR